MVHAGVGGLAESRKTVTRKPQPTAAHRWIGGLVAFLLAVAVQGHQLAHAEWSFLDSWKAHPEFKGPVPKRSDVIFSTRFKRDEALEVAKAFGATRIEWVYSSDPAYIAKLREVAPWFGGALSSTITLKNERGIAKDIEGKPIVAPWMKSWGAKWITVSNEETRTALYDLATAYLKAGASSIQIDDPLLQFTSRLWGGDFSDSSIAGFREYLQKHSDKNLLGAVGLDTPDVDYRVFLAARYGIRTAADYAKRQKDLPTTPIWHAYLKESVMSHYSRLRDAIDAVAGKRVPISMNLLLFGPDEKRDAFAVAPFADYAMVESKIEDFDVLSLQAATYRALGMGYVPSILPTNLVESRAAIAYLYALGGQPLVPWDIYQNQGPEKKPTRFFGKIEEYSDLYKHVRRNAEVIDRFELLPVVGILAQVTHYDLKNTLALVRRLNRANVPFVLVPVGASYTINAERLRRLKLLISVGSFPDPGDDILEAIEAIPIDVVPSDKLSDLELRKLSPVQEQLPESIRVVVRGATAGQSALAIHVVSISNTRNADVMTECGTPFSIKKEFLGKVNFPDIFVRTVKNNYKVAVGYEGDQLMIRLPRCDSWEIIEAKF